ncbi:hypothetical protein FBZ93_115208 [Bradyrhizobium macuxiense]|uniref:DUF3828 domain-containing protein n=1 Tax=Bradyrhizobium macuxiense TaxID=1755647 RepID=A0A560LA83_9BRAD|nr:hypothetical protein [Bradyrhizobium macuxiense]TWB90090.1 hypothetical protein FBZ93_115208 [Bradyrhizobium macuxiense]
MGRGKFLAGVSLVAAVLGAGAADAGFRTPESLIRNVYAYYGKGSAAFSNGLPRDEETARQFFDPSLRGVWTALHDAPYDFLVQSPTWRIGPIAIATPRRQFDKTDVTVTFDNEGRAVTLNFIVVNGPDGWVIADVESPHDSLRMFLMQFRR